MSSEQLDAERIFNAAREKTDRRERAGYLDGVCGTDVGLRAKIEALLAADLEAGTFLQSVGPDPDETIPQTGRGNCDGDTFASPSKLAESAGQLIGRYKLLEALGEGGFGSVWMAEQKEPVKRRVALKIIKLGMDTKQVIARFEAERQALAMMDHPNIAKVLDAGATQTGRPYFVMELIRGVPILEYCDTEKLDTRARLGLFIKSCHAIQHAHQKGIIHRDIKPSNVMITLHDGVPVPKVIDFGIAKATNQELTNKTLFTHHRQMIGTPAYMSPEQAEMSGLDIDTRSDIYSLGVLLYELLTGTTPFSNDELTSKGYAEMMRLIREIEPHRPSTRLSTLGDSATRTAQQRRVALKELRSVLRGDLDWIVMKCLEKDRSRRYETANGLAIDLERHLHDEPVVAGPPGARYKLRKFIKRNRVSVVAGSAIAVVVVLGVIGTTWGLLAARAQAERAQRELARAVEVKRLITGMLSSVSPWIAQGADTTLLRGILDDTAARLANGEIEDELIAADLHAVVGRTYLSLRLNREAHQHLPVALEIRTRLLGTEHPDTLQSMADQMSLDGFLGRRAPLEADALAILEIRKRVLGPEHPDTLSSMETLALIYGSAGRYTEAEAMMRELLEIRGRVLGPEDPATLNSLHFVAVASASQGRYVEAEAMVRKVLDTRERVLGPEHPDTLRSMDDTVRLYLFFGRYQEALPIAVKAADIGKRVLGEQNAHALQMRSTLGSLYVLLERYEDAIEAFEAVVSERRRIVGRMRKAAEWRAMRNLGDCYEKVDRHPEALALYRELLENLPTEADDVKIAPAAFTVAWVLTRDIEGLRDPDRGLAFAQRAVALDHASGGRGASQYLDTLALAQHQTGDTTGAIETQKRAIATIPQLANETIRTAYQSHLGTYEAALAGQSDLPGEKADH